jgi:hypothetical protein
LGVDADTRFQREPGDDGRLLDHLGERRLAWGCHQTGSPNEDRVRLHG